MTHPARALQTLLVIPIFALAACGASGATNTHPGVGTGGTPATTVPASATTSGAGGPSTTSCIPP